MKCCDICGRKIKQGEDILEFKNKTYCVDCRQQREAQGNAPWNEYLKDNKVPIPTPLIVGLIIFFILVVGGLIALVWWWKKSSRESQ